MTWHSRCSGWLLHNSTTQLREGMGGLVMGEEEEEEEEEEEKGNGQQWGKKRDGRGERGAKGRKAFYYCTGFGVDLMN